MMEIELSVRDIKLWITRRETFQQSNFCYFEFTDNIG